MNILYVVFVNVKLIEKKFQENSSKNTNVKKKWIIWRDFTPFKSSHWKCSDKKDFVKIYANFTGKHLCCLFLMKLQVSRPTTLLKRDSDTGVFLWKFRNF